MSINDKTNEITSRLCLAVHQSKSRGLRPPRRSVSGLRVVKDDIREGIYNQAYKKCPSPLSNDAYYNYCAVGYIYDCHIQSPQYGLWLDRDWLVDSKKHILTISAHELGHCLAKRADSMDNEKDYGLMNWSGPEYDNRSYFHEDHIIYLRTNLPHFDISSF